MAKLVLAPQTLSIVFDRIFAGFSSASDISLVSILRSTLVCHSAVWCATRVCSSRSTVALQVFSCILYAHFVAGVNCWVCYHCRLGHAYWFFLAKSPLQCGLIQTQAPERLQIVVASISSICSIVFPASLRYSTIRCAHMDVTR